MRQLDESPLASGWGTVPLPLTTSEEQLRLVWQDWLTRLECVWMDVLDARDQVYASAEEHLEAIRRLDPSSCKEGQPLAQRLVSILEKAARAKDDESKEMAVHLSRMESLVQELEWICDEYDPDVPKPPGAAPKDKRDYLRDKAKKQSAEKNPPKTEAVDPDARVLAVLEQAAIASDQEAAFLEAGRVLAAVIQEETDVSSAYVELGAVYPGNAPRLDVYLEWAANGGRPSDCYGLSRVCYAGGEVILEQADGQVGARLSRPSDQALAGQLYRQASLFYDVSPRRIWRSERVAPALYRLIERARRGEQIPESAWAGVVSGLRIPLSLQEGMSSTALEIHVSQEGPRSYFFEWVTPLSEGERTQAPPANLGVGEQPAYLREHWRTPSLRISIRSGAVSIGETAIQPDDVDEEIAAALRSLATQNEARVDGYLAERATVQVDRQTRLQVCSTALGEALLERKKHSVTRGIFHKHNRTHAEDSWHTCGDCELCIPKYPGRYPRYCPNCGCDMSSQDNYPGNADKLAPAPVPPDKPLTEPDLPARIEVVDNAVLRRSTCGRWWTGRLDTLRARPSRKLPASPYRRR
jgi:hypothetical protein